MTFFILIIYLKHFNKMNGKQQVDISNLLQYSILKLIFKQIDYHNYFFVARYWIQGISYKR